MPVLMYCVYVFIVILLYSVVTGSQYAISSVGFFELEDLRK